MNRFSTVLFASVLFVPAACESGPATGDSTGESDRSGAGAQAAPERGAAPQAEAEVFAVDGTVKSVDAAERRVTISHEDVPGYMSAMTMPFYAEDATMLAGLAEGDAVRFEFRKPSSGHRHDLVSITKRGD